MAVLKKVMNRGTKVSLWVKILRKKFRLQWKVEAHGIKVHQILKPSRMLEKVLQNKPKQLKEDEDHIEKMEVGIGVTQTKTDHETVRFWVLLGNKVD